jgi:HK97 family phage portal protein
MGLIDKLKLAIQSKPVAPVRPVETKTPDFSVVNFSKNNPFQSLVEDKYNYFDQYILYTYKCIDYISDKVASAPIRLMSGESEADDDILMKDLASFNPYMTLWEARKLKDMHLRLVGAAYWYIDRAPEINDTVEYYPLDPTQMQIKTNSIGLPAAYQYKDSDGKLVTLDPMDVVYHRRMNPKNWFEGLSQVKQMQYWTNAYASGAQYNMNIFGNDGKPEMFLFFEGIDDEERERIEMQLQEKYLGSRNARRTGVVGIEPKVIEVTKGQKELDYVNGMQMLRQDILAGFGIPEALLFPSATNSNTKEARTMFQADTLEPALRQEQSVLNEQLIPKVNKRRTTGNLLFVFDDPVEGDKDSDSTRVTAEYQGGIIKRNEARELLGYDPDNEADGYVNENTAPEPEEGADDAEVDDSDSDEEKGVAKAVKALNDKLDSMLHAGERAEQYAKAIEMADSQEGILYQAGETLFKEQAKRAVDYINAKDPTVRGIFKKESEIEATVNTFRSAFEAVLVNSNEAANLEIKQKLFRKGSAKFVTYKAKALSIEAQNALAKKLEYFADEISVTTQKHLRKAISEGIRNGFDKTQFRKRITDIFNGYLDGALNIETLKKYDLYSPAIGVDIEGVVSFPSSARYKEMFDRIVKDLKGQDQAEALRALKGLMDPSDPVAKELNDLLATFGVGKDAKITQNRVEMIARTEATYARNLSLNDTYSDNPFVKARTWISAQDNDTRTVPDGGHRKANDQTQPIGEPFNVGGQKLMFPGDTSLGATAMNIVQCRCRIVAEVD